MVMGIAALTAVACGSGDEDSVFGSSGAGGTASSGSAGAGQGGDGGVNLSGSGGSGGAASSGCSKVDFLFIIDNSVSMQDQQTALIGSFPGFIQSIQNTLSAGSDYHIMVTDTDDATRCTPANCQSGAMSANTLCDAPNGYACTTQFEACDNIIGAGVLHPAGDGATNAPCTVLGGNRYMVEGEPDLTASFSCVAQVGLAGHPAERPMDSLVGAMSPALNDAGGCNDGFLRDDAILVVTFISDDPNYEDADGPQEWYDAVVAAKGGKTDSVVVLGLTPAFDGCSSSSKPAKGQHWSDFIAMWGSHGLEASVCNLDYAPFFEQAVSVIDEVCDEFEAPR
jgi:hypothetical protein